MDNLLLWSKCPTIDAGSCHKALIVRNIEHKYDKSFGRISQHPDTNNTSNVKEIKSGIDFHYIMKVVGNRYLLAKYNKLSSYNDQVLEGWVSNNSILPWSYKVFLEPNWEPSIVESLKGKKAYLYKDGEAVDSFEFGRINTIKKEATKYRLEPGFIRYPIVDYSSRDSSKYNIIGFISDSIEKISNISNSQTFYTGLTTDVECNVYRENRKNVFLTAFHGFVNRKDSLTGFDYWKPVLLLSAEELIELIKNLEPLINAIKMNSYGAQERRNYKKAVAYIIHCFTGQDPEEINLLSSEEITQIIARLNIKTTMLTGEQKEKSFTLSDILTCSERDFSQIIKQVENKIYYLSMIPRNSNYKFHFVQNGEKYYWIPLEMIP
jgi:hypothetical protein